MYSNLSGDAEISGLIAEPIFLEFSRNARLVPVLLKFFRIERDRNGAKKYLTEVFRASQGGRMRWGRRTAPVLFYVEFSVKVALARESFVVPSAERKKIDTLRHFGKREQQFRAKQRGKVFVGPARSSG